MKNQKAPSKDYLRSRKLNLSHLLLVSKSIALYRKYSFQLSFNRKLMQYLFASLKLEIRTLWRLLLIKNVLIVYLLGTSK